MAALVEFRNFLLGEDSSPDTNAGPATAEQKKLIFIERVCDLFRGAEIVDGLEPCSWTGTATGNSKVAIDAGGYNPIDGTASFLLAIVDGSNAHGVDDLPTLSKPDLARNAQCLARFAHAAVFGGLKGKLSADSPAEDLRAEVAQRHDQITKIKLFLVTDHQLSDRVKVLPPEQVGEISCEYHVWDVARLSELSAMGNEPIEIDLQGDHGVTIPCLPVQTAGDEYRAFLCVVPATLLADMYDSYGARLLETNVRGFLSEKGKVNGGIRATIVNKPEMFFAYNNGITATASSVELDSQQSQIVHLRDLQIVNGGQTTASLFWARKKYKANLDAVNVQMKLSVLSAAHSDRFDEFVSNVARYANSQNKVADSDLFANHPFHREMDKLSKRVGVPKIGGGNIQTYWFYERARKQYDNERRVLSKADLSRFDERFPKSQLLDKTEFAKYWSCWNQHPHFVSQGAQKNFRKFADTVADLYDRRPNEFNEVFFKRIVAVAIIYRALETLVVRQPWYEGYRINILAYALASIFRLVEMEGLRVNLVLIFANQGVNETLLDELLAFAKKVYDFAKTCPQRESRAQWGNLGQWFKEGKCWDYVSNQPLSLPSSLRPLLISANQHDSQSAAGITQGRADGQIKAQIEAQELREGGYWKKLLDWNQQDPVLTAVEVEAISQVCNLSATRPVPERLAEILITAKRRAESSGFA